MKRRGKILMWGMLLLVSAACTKVENALPDSNDPVFRVDGTFGGEALEMIAGDDGMYMYTFTEAKNGVNIFSGELSDGNLSVEIGLYDGDIDMNSTTSMSIISQSENWAFESGQDLVIISKDMFPNHHLINEINWVVNGAFAGINMVKIKESGVYEVCAFVTFTDGNSTSLCNQLLVGFQRNGNFKIRHYSSQSGELNLWMEDIQGEVDSVSWFVDNELVGSAMEYSGIVSAEQHAIKAVVVFSNGAKRTRCMVVDGLLSGHFIDDFTGFEQNLQNMVLRDYNWVLKVNSNGTQYSSLCVDNSNSHIEIDDISYYGLNSDGRKVYKITAKFDGVLKNINGGDTKTVSINTVFGLEIPE